MRVSKCVGFGVAALVFCGAVSSVVAQPALGPRLDFNGNGTTDLAVYNPDTASWYAMDYTGAGFQAQAFGDADYLLVPGDYSGIGRAEMGVFATEAAVWYTKAMNEKIWTKSFQFGFKGSTPVPGDYDGDGKLDTAIYNDGSWYIMQSRDGFRVESFGWKEAVPVPAGDYDGDGKADLTVVHVNDNKLIDWFFFLSASGDKPTTEFGPETAIPAPGDYDGDGKTEMCVYYKHESGECTWYWQDIGGKGFTEYDFGFGDTVPVPGDYDGDETDDYAIYLQETGMWYIKLSSSAEVPSFEGGFGWKDTIAVGAPVFEAVGAHQEIVEPVATGVVDGSGGFLWKPESHQNAKLLVLWRTDIYPHGTISKVVVSHDPAGEEVIDTLFDHGLYTSGRWKYRSHSMTGAQYGDDVYVVAFFNNGDLPKPYHIPTGALRWD